MFNYMISQHQNFKLQMQPQTVSGSDLSHSKATSQKNCNQDDLDPDISNGLNPGLGITQVFREPSNLDSHTSRLKTQMHFVTPPSCDLKPDTTKPTYRKIVVSANLDSSLSACLDPD